MGDKTRISWTERTLNFWMGCTRVSPGCENCYMFDELRRYGRDPSVVGRTKPATWNQAYDWDRQAAEAGARGRVFVCSWSDFFHAAADPWRGEAWRVLRACPNLDFQVLTKRPARIAAHLPEDWGDGYPNVWLGVSVESNEFVGRVDALRQVPARLRFISAEPLLGPLPDLDLTGIDWLIVGGESGPRYRHMDHGWARELRDRAAAAGVAYFFKQSADLHPGRGTRLDGVEHKAFPLPVVT